MKRVQQGTVLAGKYRIDSVLGEGGMGYVLAATHLQLDRRVAIKLLHLHVLAQPELVERFAREARLMARIANENVARVLDVGTLDDSTPYIVMDVVAHRG